MSGQRWLALPQESEKDREDTGSLLEEPGIESRPHHNAARHNVLRRWQIVSFFQFLLLFIFIAATWWPSLYGTISKNSYEKGFETELDPAKPNIELTQTTFTGGLRYDSNGTLTHPSKHQGPAYVGIPGHAIDAAWDDLLVGHWIELDEGESANTKGLLQSKSGKTLTGVDVMHQLHCLNMIRKGLYPDYYHHPDTAEHNLLHLEHCVDYLRQALMCCSDLTPAVLYREPHAPKGLVPDFQTTHTCRNFDRVREWTMERRYFPEEAR